MPRSLLTLLLALTLALSACGKGDNSSNNAENAKELETPSRVTLGGVFGLTGIQSSYDVLSMRGARLAVSEANKTGGLLGGPVKLVVVDGKSKPAVTAHETERLIAAQPKLSALFGLSDTDLVLAAATVAAKHDLLFVTSGATSPKLPDEVPGVLYLACFGDNVQAAAGAEWAYRKLGARKAAVLFDSGHTYTKLLHGYFQTRFKQLGGTIVSVGSFTTPDDAKEAIAALPKSDLVYVAAEDPPEAMGVSKLIRAAGHNEPILGGDGFDAESVWKSYTASKDIYFTTHAYLGAQNEDPDVRAFVDLYSKAYGIKPDAFAALGYDAANLVMKAVENAGSAAPAKVLEAMGEIGIYDGVTGTLYFPHGRHVPKKTVTIILIKDGKENLVEQLVPDHVPPP